MPDSLPPRLAAILADFPLEELAFTPVPVKPRRDGWTAARQQAFILRLALCGSVSVAARAVGKNRVSAYRLRDHPGAASFAAAWDKAIGWGRDRTLDMAMERALCGEIRPVFYRGVKRGEYVRHDNRLMMSVLGRLDRAEAFKPCSNEEFGRLLDAICPALGILKDNGFSPRSA